MRPRVNCKNTSCIESCVRQCNFLNIKFQRTVILIIKNPITAQTAKRLNIKIIAPGDNSASFIIVNQMTYAIIHQTKSHINHISDIFFEKYIYHTGNRLVTTAHNTNDQLAHFHKRSNPLPCPQEQDVKASQP